MRKIISIFLFILFSSCYIFPAGMQINLKKGTSQVINADNVNKIEISNQDIAAATILSDKEIIVEAKKTGTCVINLYTPQGVENLVVNVKNSAKTEAMIEIDVQVLEITDSDTANYGVDWPTLINSAANMQEQNPPLLAFGKFTRGPIDVIVDFLVQKNYAKVLAKPKLLTANGKNAEFLSGGEVPIATTDTQGHTSVEWKKYGVSLGIEPLIGKNNNITAKLRAEVSDLDYANAVKIGISGGVMPALKTRKVETTITVEPENTIVIAGMIQNEQSKITSGVPIISGIPLLGELFKTTQTIDQKTELVIFVTPKISGG